MLNVIIIAGALASVAVTSRESLVDSRQSSVGSSPEGSSTIYHLPFSSSQYPVVSRQWTVVSNQGLTVESSTVTAASVSASNDAR